MSFEPLIYLGSAAELAEDAGRAVPVVVGNCVRMGEGIMLSVDRVIAAPPEAVWKLLVDLEAWPQWGPPIRRAELDRPFERLELRATGRVYTYLPVPVPFVVSEFDPGRFWAWTVAGLPATSHRVDPLQQRCARATISVPWWSAPYLSVCAVALRRIETLLAEPRSSPA